MEKSLPADKMTAHFNDHEAAKLCVLNKITFCEARQKVSAVSEYYFLASIQYYC